nr:tyrosine-type recombinase/integrase [Ardenticatena sp.]
MSIQSTTPLETAIATFLARLARRERTHHTYATGLRALREFLASQTPPVETVGALWPDVLADFYHHIADRYAALTIRTYLAAARAFLRFLRAEDALPFALDRANAALRDAMTMGDRLRYPAIEHTPNLPVIVTYYDDMSDLPPPDTPRHRAQILARYRNRALLYTLFSTAGRLSEVAALTREDVQDGRAKRVLVVGKRDKQRILFLSDEARAAIRAYLQQRKAFGVQSRYLFISHGRNEGKPLTPQSIWNIVKKAARAHGLDHVSPHTFRHWRATQMLNEGVPAEVVKDFLGHEQITTTTTIYARYLTSHIEEAFDRHTPSIRDIQKRVQPSDEEQTC